MSGNGTEEEDKAEDKKGNVRSGKKPKPSKREEVEGKEDTGKREEAD